MRPVPWMHAFVDVPGDRVGTALSFWAAVTGWDPSPPWPGHSEFTSLTPRDGAPYLHVQTVDAPARVHLDVAGDLDGEPGRLAGLGAVHLRRGDRWQVLRSPAGLPFCVCTDRPGARPAAARWPAGHRSRLVQLCIDVPPVLASPEFAFWRDATGWAEDPVDAPEFRRLVPRERSPLQLLVQRLGDDDGAAESRAHLDLGTDDIPAEVARVEALGARVLRPGRGFVVLEDPLGLPFCVTGNDPG